MKSIYKNSDIKVELISDDEFEIKHKNFVFRNYKISKETVIK